MTTRSDLHPLKRSAGARAGRRAWKRWAKRIALVLVGAGIVAAVVVAWLPDPVVVDVVTARRAPLEVEVTDDGRTRVADRFLVSAPIHGTLQRLDLEAGAVVTKGSVVARIEAPDPALLDARTRDEAAARVTVAVARQRRADSAIARAKVARDAAVREAERARGLARTNAISGVERERAELAEQLAVRDLAATETERAAAAAELAAARTVLGTGRDRGSAGSISVLAPIDGTVLRVLRDSAGPIAAGSPLLELGDLRALEVVVDVLSRDAAQITAGMEVAIEGWGGDRALRGRVARVEPSAVTRISALGVEEQRVTVVTTIEDPPPGIGDGFRVDARIFTWRAASVLVVPASAVFRDHERWAVFAIDGGRAQLRTVELGHRGKRDVEVLRGINEGEELVQYPGDRVVDGGRVTPR